MWRYPAYAILLTCQNLCDIDIAYPILHSGDNIAILPNPNCYHTKTPWRERLA